MGDADAVALGSPSDWQIKGEGNANVVFEYRGPLPHLVGCACPPAAGAWAGGVGGAQLSTQAGPTC